MREFADAEAQTDPIPGLEPLGTAHDVLSVTSLSESPQMIEIAFHRMCDDYSDPAELPAIKIDL